jgi:ABC-type bacteriocin/lantibiotic exporter with double-glycine peptidase domain
MALDRMDGHVNNYLGARENHFTILIRQYSLLIVFKVIVALGLLAIGGILVMDQRMNIGQFVAAEIIILFVMASVEKLVLTLETIYDVLTGLEKIGQVTDLELDGKPDRAPSGIVNSESGMSLNLEGVYFSYPGSNEMILKDINLQIPAGERVVVTGTNGSGKSTLLFIMSALYDVPKGTVAFDNLPKGNLCLEDLHSVIGDCLRQGELFEGTVLENITMGRKEATFENVKWAVENLGLTPVIRSLSNGFETRLNPTGDKLPRSIVQRLLLARAIADRPRLLLLENVFEAMDPADARQIIDFLIDPVHPWTFVAISSNTYLAERADRVLFMDQGTLVVDRPNV